MRRLVLAAVGALAVAGCQTTPKLHPGDFDFSIAFQEIERTYKLHVPPQLDVSRALPLVIMLHGGMGTADGAAAWYGWNEQSDLAGFLVAYPQGVDRTWNAEHCCGAARRDGMDDVGFILAVIADIQARAPVDPRRIFATGMSNGAMMSYRLAAERPDIFAAIGPVAGAIGGQANASSPLQVIPTPSQPVAVMIFHGMADQNVLYEGGETVSGLTPGRIDLSVDDAVAFWVQADGAAATPVDSANETGHVLRRAHAAADGYGDVVRYAIVGQGHAWPGGLAPSVGPIPIGDPPSQEISATAALWEFFASHPKPQP
jgi:polyhydroxybutyrate depolymerase